MTTVNINGKDITTIERTPPVENTDCQLYELDQKNSDGDYLYFNIGLRRDNVTYYADNNASYAIIPLESLRESDCEYYALYIISSEAQDLILTFDDLELTLPEATTKIPGVEVTIGGYMQDYFLNEVGTARISDDYPTSAVLTPLGLYVNDEHHTSMPLMYRNAALVCTDGSEINLSDISNDKLSYIDFTFHYVPDSFDGAVYLFNEILDTSTVKSLLLYGDIEIPFDGSAPFARSSGRTLELVGTKALLWDISEQIQSYVVSICPDTWTVTLHDSSESYLQTGWNSVTYLDDETLYFNRRNQENETDAYFNISLAETSGGALEDEARAKVEAMNVKHRARGYENDLTFTVTGTGTYNGIDVLAVECGESQPGLYKRCLFALYEGKLLTIEYDGYTGQPNDYAFDALLNLITF